VKDIERTLISAYLDAEVESPWKEKVARRLTEDPVWAAEAQWHLRVKASLASSPEPDWSEVQTRVKARMESRGSPTTSRSLPLAWLSVAAAALLVLAAGGGFWLGRSVSAPGTADVAEIQVQVPKAMGLKLSGEGQLLMASTLQGPRR